MLIVIIGNVVNMFIHIQNVYPNLMFTHLFIGLHDGAIVSCKVVEELPVLDTVYVTAMNQKDWEMLVSASAINKLH